MRASKLEFFKKTFLFRTPVRKQRRRFDLAWFVVFVFINHHETSLATTGREREREMGEEREKT